MSSDIFTGLTVAEDEQIANAVEEKNVPFLQVVIGKLQAEVVDLKRQVADLNQKVAALQPQYNNADLNEVGGPA